MSNQYKTERVCDCGYTTLSRVNWHSHKTRHCKLRTSNESDDKERIASLERQLEKKDQQLEATHQQMKEQLEASKEQLAAKDKQINDLIREAKRPRTVNNTTNNNRFVVEQHIRVFGNESVEHISTSQIQSLLADPSNAVSQYIKLKHRKAPGGVNQNIRIPNKNKAIYQVVVDGGGDKEWENKSKGEVLEKLYDDSSGQLEAEADEETIVGSNFLSHQDKVKLSESGSDGGRLYKDQLDKIHNIL